MVCASCGRAAKSGARFCGACGAALAPRCPACGAECEPDLRFCEACGASLGAQAAARPAQDAVARKVVTIVFADLVGSTALHERLDAEAVRQFMESYYAAMRLAVEAHGGRVTQVMGDGVKAVFGAPRVAEDDAIRAVRAGIEMQRAFRELAEHQRARVGETGLRVAVNTGEVVADDATEIIGDPVNVAARLQEQGGDGDVVIGESTRRIVASLVTLERLGSFALKGRAEPVTAWRVVSTERPAGVAATPFVGRDEELARLAAVYDAAIAAPATRLAVLLGSPGLGKSRLLAEFGRQLEGRARVLTAQCSPVGVATFAPLAEALRASFEGEAGGGEGLRAALDALIAAGDTAERSAIAVGMDALLSGTPALPEEIFFVVRRLLSALATEQPVVLVIDDFQWAEPLLLDFTEHLVQWGAGVPLLVLGAARPELRDTRSSFTTPGGLVSDVVTLGGLDAGAAMRLAASVIGADTLPAAVAGRVLATSEGNPLFLGELVRMLVNDGILQKQGERWKLTVDLAALEMPPTIQALLAARIERLRPEERLVLERAAVVGRRFSRAAVTHLLPHEAHADLDARLEALRRSELVEADAGWLLGEPALRFHHVLIRDAAYRRVLRGTRAELHARLADWLEARAGESVEHQERIGWHLEQAHLHLRELGPLDANGRALGERAARILGAAGQRALARDDLAPAADLLGRALDCLGDADPARGDLALDWCEALLAAGEVGPAERALAELGRFTAESGRLRAWHTCFTGQLAALADPKALRASAEAVAAAAEALAAAGDVQGEAKAHQVHADALGRLGQIGACEAALDKALAAARRAGDRRRANAVLAGAPLAALWGPSPVTRASGRCLDVVRVLRITQGAPAVEAVALRCQAVLETLRGRSDAARRMIASSRRLVEELGITQRLLEVDTIAGLIELLEGDAAAAERCLRTAYDGFRAHGLGVDAARTAALLGRALLTEGRAAEAETLSHESEALAGDDFKAAIAWRGVRAEALAARGGHADGVELARAAVEIAAATDDLLDHADARSALAAVLRASGRSQDADAEEAHAIELWEQKGATLLVERARSTVAGVQLSTSAPAVPAPSLAPTRRRVPPNIATAAIARLNAVISARDDGLLATLFAGAFVHVHHPTSSEWGRAGFIETTRRLWRAADLSYRLEPLATLGESLALVQQSVSASGTPWRQSSIGPYATEEVIVVEVGADGREWRGESFAVDRLGDALARLYERYAELRPEGPAREGAVAVARVVAGMLDPPDSERWARMLAAGVEFVDRRLLGVEPVRGADALLASIRPLRELSGQYAFRVDDVFAVQPDALVVRFVSFGTERAGGGAYERPFMMLLLVAEGRVTRIEQFDSESVAEALARFDELMATPAPPAVRRRVRPNAATANAARLETAVRARDGSAIGDLHADSAEIVHHLTGVTFGREGTIRSYRALIRSPDLGFRQEPLATLGDSLALCRTSIHSSASVGRDFDVGASEHEQISLIEVDANGRRCHSEVFAPKRLGDAIARLYERYAEGLPAEPERTRAAATARTVARVPRAFPSDIDSLAAVLDPDVEFVDHRPLGLPSRRGAQEFLDHQGTLFELADDLAVRIDDVVALRPDAWLGRWINSGRLRAGGGAFEREFLFLDVFGADGLLTRRELFDVDRIAEALARFDELTAPPARPVGRPVRPNAAVANVRRFEAALAARDREGFPELLAGDAVMIEHPTGAEFDRSQLLRNWHTFLAPKDLNVAYEPLATLGDLLALCRQSLSAGGVARGRFDVGAYEREEFALVEVDVTGRRRRLETFATRSLGDALARLYERHAELLPEGRERALAAANARLLAIWNGPIDPERDSAALSPSLEVVDHRKLGTWYACGAEAFAAHLRSWCEVAESATRRTEAVLGLRADALLAHWTHSGTDRTGGGPYERTFLLLWTLGADGLATHWELFDLEQEAEALARFDELEAAPAPAPHVRRRLRPNAATAYAARVEAALAGRDADALPTLLADGCEVVDHTTAVDYDQRGILSGFRALLKARELRFRHEALATLGPSLALCRQSVSALGLATREFDIGTYETEKVLVLEGDENGRLRRAEVFAPDHLGDAIARLYERYAERFPEGPERARSAALARSLAACVLAAPSPDLYRAILAPDVEFADHRTLVALPPARGASELQRRIEIWFEASEEASHMVEDVLDLRADGLLVRQRERGRDRASGGSFESQRLTLWTFDADSLLAQTEMFDADREAEALARFDELTAEPPPTRAPLRPWLANAATRAFDHLRAAWKVRDWEGLAAGYAPQFRCSDRRKGVLLDLDRDEYLEFMRTTFEMSSSRLAQDVLATRGDRLALARVLVEAAESDAGPSEIESLVVSEVNESGERVAVVRFDPDDLDAAYAELDERYGATRMPLPFLRAVSARDWGAVAALLARDLVVEDHRPLGSETIRGAAAYIAFLQALVDLAPDATPRADHMELSDRGGLVIATVRGTWEGGVFEINLVVVGELNAHGRAERIDAYDLDQLDAARARFAAIGASSEAAPRDPLAALVKPNAATAAMDRILERFEARDWNGMRALWTDDVVSEDRRRHVLLSRDGAGWLADWRLAAESRFACQRQLVGTAGDRVALERFLWSVGPAGGRSEVEMLWLTEVDEHGRITFSATFDLDDWRAASREAWTRWLARDAEAAAVIGPMVEALEGWNDHDRARVCAALADDLVTDDHRLTGEGQVNGAEANLDNMAVMWRLAPDVQIEPRLVLALERHGAVGVSRYSGTLPEGGAWEFYLVNVQTVARDRVTRIELFELKDVDAALARLSELRPDPLRIPPNAATRASESWLRAFEAGDWETFRAVYSPALLYEDRRRGIRVSGGLDMLEQSNRLVADSGARVSRQLLATAGERLALERMQFVRDDHFEVEILVLVEVDGDERIVAVVNFDPDDRRAASRELLDRWAQSGAAHGPSIDLRRAILDHDLERVRSLLPPGFVLHDQRKGGAGRLDVHAFIDWLAALFEESPDAIIEPLYYLAVEPHGTLAVAHTFGTNTSGGAFESVFAQIVVPDSCAELLELDDLELARARFEALRPDPTRIPPNAASRAMDLRHAAWRAGDWDALRALASSDFRFEDRSRIALVSGDVEMWLENIRLVHGGAVERELIGTAGERVALERVLWTGGPASGPVERDKVRLVEVDAEGRIRASIRFDPDDRAAAFLEAQARFVAGEAAAIGGQAPTATFDRAFAHREWETIRSCLVEDAVIWDRRALGILGKFDRGGWLESLRTAVDLAPDLKLEMLWILAWNALGCVRLIRMPGTREGGSFESVFLQVLLVDRDRVQRMEAFDPLDSDRALARFAELCADPP